MRSIAQLVEACLENCQDSWDELVDRYARLVYSTARNWGLNESDADDVFQAVFLILCQRLGTIRDPERLGSWLITSARRECWRLCRRQPVVSTINIIESPISDSTTADAEQLEEQYLIWLALEELGGQCERLLRALFGHSGDENYASIAEHLGMEIGSIGPTRARCFLKLERILGRLGIDRGESSD